MYQAMVACQALHPDPEDVDSEDEFADYNEDEEDGEENGDDEWKLNSWRSMYRSIPFAEASDERPA